MSGNGIDWQEAVARLTRERALAETWAAALHRNRAKLPAAGIDQLATIYGEARAEFEGVISGLIVVLARGKQPASLPDLEARLTRGVQRREAFCAGASALLPPRAGERSIVADIVKGALGPLIEAVKSLYLRHKDDDALLRKTIETQLEAARWPDFARVPQAA